MKVILDHNLPKSLARLLAERGLEASHLLELGLADASDRQVRERLAAEKIIFVSRDGDFWLNPSLTLGGGRLDRAAQSDLGLFEGASV